jgi:uncharacterized membrane protein YgcG
MIADKDVPGFSATRKYLGVGSDRPLGRPTGAPAALVVAQSKGDEQGATSGRGPRRDRGRLALRLNAGAKSIMVKYARLVRFPSVVAPLAALFVVAGCASSSMDKVPLASGGAIATTGGATAGASGMGGSFGSGGQQGSGGLTTSGGSTGSGGRSASGGSLATVAS